MRKDQLDAIKSQICMRTPCSKCLFNEDGICKQQYANTTLIFKAMSKTTNVEYFKKFLRVAMK